MTHGSRRSGQPNRQIKSTEVKEITKQEKLAAKLKIKVLWLASWRTVEIASFLALPLEFVEYMVEVYKNK